MCIREARRCSSVTCRRYSDSQATLHLVQSPMRITGKENWHPSGECNFVQIQKIAHWILTDAWQLACQMDHCLSRSLQLLLTNNLSSQSDLMGTTREHRKCASFSIPSHHLTRPHFTDTHQREPLPPKPYITSHETYT